MSVGSCRTGRSRCDDVDAEGILSENDDCDADHRDERTTGGLHSDHGDERTTGGLHSDHGDERTTGGLHSDHGNERTTGGLHSDHGSDERIWSDGGCGMEEIEVRSGRGIQRQGDEKGSANEVDRGTERGQHSRGSDLTRLELELERNLGRSRPRE